jgi:hypothetical protein
MGRRKTLQVHSVTVSRRQTPSNTESLCSGDSLMEIFCPNKIILAILTFPLTEIIFTHLINPLLSYKYVLK